jgi:hypothetical protein
MAQEYERGVQIWEEGPGPEGGRAYALPNPAPRKLSALTWLRRHNGDTPELVCRGTI